jgi:hypothetical protein
MWEDRPPAQKKKRLLQRSFLKNPLFRLFKAHHNYGVIF